MQISSKGPMLVWFSDTITIHVGGGRFEFRLSDGSLLGYPREAQGELHLTLSPIQLQILEAQDASLQVWLGGRRIDSDAPKKVFRSSPTTAVFEDPVPTTPTVPTDPARKGNYTILRASYDVSALKIDEFPVPIEVVGEVTYAPDAPGKRPLILFLHGRHSTCYRKRFIFNIFNVFVNSNWPCRLTWQPIPSHKGYRYVADLLASQGNIVVSISANGINAQDWASKDDGTSARSILIHHHLSMWSQWSSNGGDPWGKLFLGRLDLNLLVLVGHSRGGEGVHKAAIDATPSDPYKIVGLVTYGPTAFGHQVTPDIHSVTILPTCDGDVYDLEGQAYIDYSRDIAYSEALRSAVISLGANHNYFNTEWTPGLAAAPAWDDWYSDKDPVCGSQGGSVRLTPQEQQAVGAAYTAALIKLAIYQDATMLPLLDGSFVRPAAIGRAEVAVNAVGGAKHRLLYHPEDSDQPTLWNGMTAWKCQGNSYSTSLIPVCGDGNYSATATPHWLPINSRPSPLALELQWTNHRGAIAQFTVHNTLCNLMSLDSLDVRIANDPGNSGVHFNLIVADRSGRNATLQTNLTMIHGWPGSKNLDRVHARTLRGSLVSVQSKVDLESIASIFLITQSESGHVWVLDIKASQTHIQVPTALNLPKLSVETVTVLETDGPEQYALNIVADPPLTSPGSIWVQRYYTGTGYRLDLVPRTSTVAGQILIDHVGDNTYSSFPYASEYLYTIEAIKGVVTGDYIGSLTIEEDELSLLQWLLKWLLHGKKRVF